MSSVAIVALIGLGFGAMAARRRSLAILLLAAQSLLLGVVALTEAGDGAGLLLSGAILAIRACALPALLAFACSRTPESRPVTPTTTGATRLLVATAVSLTAVAVSPPLGLGDEGAEHGAVALLCLGIAIVVMRRPALFQVLGILVAENGVYLLALSVEGDLPLAIELGVLFDLALVVTVAAAFARRMHGTLGSADTDLLRQLRD